MMFEKTQDTFAADKKMMITRKTTLARPASTKHGMIKSFTAGSQFTDGQ